MKKIVLLFTVLTLTFYTLAGCSGSSVTVSDLFEATESAIKTEKSADVDMKLSASGSISFMDSPISYSTEMDINIQADEDTSYVNGTVSYETNFLGDMKETTNIQNYYEKTSEGTVTYSYNEESDFWSEKEEEYLEGEDTSLDSVEQITNVLKKLSEKLSVKKKGNGYSVTGTLTADEIASVLSEEEIDTESLSQLGVDFSELKGSSVKIKLSFGKNKVLKSCSLEAELGENAELSEFGITSGSATISITINKIGGVSVSVPEEVKENAI